MNAIVISDTKKNGNHPKTICQFFCLMGDHRQRLNYLHLMNKAAESVISKAISTIL